MPAVNPFIISRCCNVCIRRILIAKAGAETPAALLTGNCVQNADSPKNKQGANCEVGGKNCLCHKIVLAVINTQRLQLFLFPAIAKALSKCTNPAGQTKTPAFAGAPHFDPVSIQNPNQKPPLPCASQLSRQRERTTEITPFPNSCNSRTTRQMKTAPVETRADV